MASGLRERSQYTRGRFEAQVVSRTSVRFHRDRAHQEAVNARFENQTTRDKETRHSISPRSTPRILAHPKILSLQLLFRALFSVKSNWALACTARDRCSDGRNRVQHSRDCEVVADLAGFGCYLSRILIFQSASRTTGHGRRETKSRSRGVTPRDTPTNRRIRGKWWQRNAVAPTELPAVPVKPDGRFL